MSRFCRNLYKVLGKGKYESCGCSIEYTTVKENTLIFPCVEFNKDYEKEFGKGLEKRCQNRFWLCNRDINKWCLILRKVVYPNEHIDSWKIFNEYLSPEKKEFYGDMIMKNNTDTDRKREKNLKRKSTKRFWDIKSRSISRSIHKKWYTTTNGCIWNLPKTCIEIYRLDPAYFFLSPGLAWQTCLKKVKIELDLLTDKDMLLMV